ncbi:hypothetical protein PSHT_05681 [Puccinia striiformis]|uniref:Uncharacterized protein n=1 Tax=Puccinia striiformis TaxID=27350 RepID=A0A2S4W9Y7_9BASI|nr:hypothetical protein PSHT_05681 [Puccinia striiformis]
MRKYYRRIVILVYATEFVRHITTRYHMAYPYLKHDPVDAILSGHDSTLIHDDPYYSIKDQNDNVIQVRRYHGQSPQQGGLMAIAPLLSFLSSVDSVLDTVHKLKKVWFNANLVKVVESTSDITC